MRSIFCIFWSNFRCKQYFLRKAVYNAWQYVLEKFNMDELNFLWEKLLWIFRMISNFTVEIARIHFAICEVESDNSNPGIFFINLANKPGITPQKILVKQNAFSTLKMMHWNLPNVFHFTELEKSKVLFLKPDLIQKLHFLKLYALLLLSTMVTIMVTMGIVVKG